MGQTNGSTLVPGSVIGTDISLNAAIPTQCMKHAYTKCENFGFVVGATPTAKEFVLHVARGAGTVDGFCAGCYETGSSASVTFDLKKNGTTVLSAVITVANTDTDDVVKTATIASPTYVSGDVFTAVLAVGSSTGMTGPFCQGSFVENTSPL